MKTTDERYEVGNKVICLLKEIFNAKDLGIIKRASIKVEVNEPIVVELKTLF